MYYRVENCVCDYSIVRIVNDKKEIIEILNSRSNAQLICDILNIDLRQEIYSNEKRDKLL